MEVCKGDRSAFSPPKDRLVSCLLYKEGNESSGGGVRGEDTFTGRLPQIYTSLLLPSINKKQINFGGHSTCIISAQNNWIPGVHGNSFCPTFLSQATYCFHLSPPGEIALLEGLTVVYKSSIDLYFYVIGSSYENEVRIPTPLLSLILLPKPQAGHSYCFWALRSTTSLWLLTGLMKFLEIPAGFANEST